MLEGRRAHHLDAAHNVVDALGMLHNFGVVPVLLKREKLARNAKVMRNVKFAEHPQKQGQGQGGSGGGGSLTSVETGAKNKMYCDLNSFEHVISLSTACSPPCKLSPPPPPPPPTCEGVRAGV